MSVNLPPGSTWSTTINANQGVGETFIAKAGTHNQQIAPLRHGQKLLFEGGVTVDGQNVTPYLGLHVNRPHGISVLALDLANRPVIKNYATPGQDACIWGQLDGQWNGRDWVVDGLIIQDIGAGPGLGIGVRMGLSMLLKRCDISGCGKSGIGFSGKLVAGEPASYNELGGTIDDCDIHHNAPNGGSDTGGISKVSGPIKNKVVKNSRFWQNWRANIWADFGGTVGVGEGVGVHQNKIPSGVLRIENCDIWEVASTVAHKESVFFEVASGMHLYRSRIYNSGPGSGSGLDGSQVICHNAAFCLIEECVIYNCFVNATGVAQSNRYAGTRLTVTEGNVFRGNHIYAISSDTSRMTGVSAVGGLGGGNYNLFNDGTPGTWNLFTQGNNQWFENHYYVLDTLPAARFYWNDGGVNPKTFAQWQALGHDVGATYETFEAAATPPLPPIPFAPADNRSGSLLVSTSTMIAMTGRKNGKNAPGIVTPTTIAATGRKGARGALATIAATSVFMAGTAAQAGTGTFDVQTPTTVGMGGSKQAAGTITIATPATVEAVGESDSGPGEGSINIETPTTIDMAGLKSATALFAVSTVHTHHLAGVSSEAPDARTGSIDIQTPVTIASAATKATSGELDVQTNPTVTMTGATSVRGRRVGHRRKAGLIKRPIFKTRGEG